VIHVELTCSIERSEESPQISSPSKRSSRRRNATSSKSFLSAPNCTALTNLTSRHRSLPGSIAMGERRRNEVPHRVAEVIDPRLSDAMDVPWATMAVTVPIPEEGELLFISASTSWRLEAESARERQAVALADLDARHRGPLPTIIAGDFNATPEAASIRYLTGLQSIGGRSVHYQRRLGVAGDWSRLYLEYR